MVKLKDTEVIRLALLTGFISIGGWSVFRGLTGILNLNALSPIQNLGLGLVIIWLSFKFGFSR